MAKQLIKFIKFIKFIKENFVFLLMINSSLLLARTTISSQQSAFSISDFSVVNNYIKLSFEDKRFVPFAIYNSIAALELAKKIKYQKGIDDIVHGLQSTVNGQLLTEDRGEWTLNLRSILNNDVNLYMALFDSLGYYYSNEGQEGKALECFRRVDELASYYDISISEKLKKSKLNGIAGSYQRIGLQYSDKRDYEISIEYQNKALDIYKELGDKLGLSSCYNNMGVTYINNGNNSLALDNLLKSLKIFEDIKYKAGLGNCNLNIGIIYTNEKDYSKALNYVEKALQIFDELKNKAGISTCYNILGSIYFKQGNNIKAHEYYKQALKISDEMQDDVSKADILNNIGDAYMNLGDYSEALECFYKALKLDEKSGNKINKLFLFNNIANTNLKLKRYDEALEYALKSLKSAKEQNKLVIENDGYRILKETYKLKGIYQKAMEYADLYYSTADSLYNSNKTKQIFEIQNKYESEKKENEILLLSKSKEVQDLKLRKNKIIIYALSFGSVLFLIFILIVSNLYRQRQFRKKMFIKTIETEEHERKRFAEDLHDGIGPLLSTIGLYVNELGVGGKESNKKEEELLKYTNQLIDDAIKNTKMIANNLMPGDLAQYGLIRAIEYYCNKVNKSGKISIRIATEGTRERYNKTIEIILYRVSMELINNTIKHASAGNIIINIRERDNKLLLLYKDDGQGFDVEATLKDPVKGLGLNNIINRIKTVEGECEFQSLQGKGTTANIEINLKKFSS
jgi:two-component system, NarL family, sensor kinase